MLIKGADDTVRSKDIAEDEILFIQIALDLLPIITEQMGLSRYLPFVLKSFIA